MTEVRNNPRWWHDDHTTGWDRVKEALRRDWEQTKSDFTGGTKGKDLNQDVGDTVAQALGNQPIPPGNRANPPDAADVKKAAREQDEVALELGERTQEGAARIARANEEMRWEDAQLPIRFGHGASAHYPGAWDEAFESQIRRDWEESYPGESWEQARALARRGWNHARSNS